MNDDIVTRLNIDAAWIQTCASGVYQDIGLTFRDAVYEIERLQKEVQKAYLGFNYWEERCMRAEQCLDFIYKKKRRWRLW